MKKYRRTQWRVIYKKLLKPTELRDEDGIGSMIISGKYSRYEAFCKIRDELKDGYGADDELYAKCDSPQKLQVAYLRRPTEEDWEQDCDYYAEVTTHVKEADEKVVNSMGYVWFYNYA